MTEPRSISNDATSIYSTCFSAESAGYWERSCCAPWRVCDVCCAAEPEERRDGCLEDLEESTDSRTVGGFGDRPGRPALLDIVDGVREGGKDEKDDLRCTPFEVGGPG